MNKRSMFQFISRPYLAAIHRQVYPVKTFTLAVTLSTADKETPLYRGITKTSHLRIRPGAEILPPHADVIAVIQPGRVGNGYHQQHPPPTATPCQWRYGGWYHLSVAPLCGLASRPLRCNTTALRANGAPELLASRNSR